MRDMEHYFRELVEGKRRSLPDRLLLALLVGCSFFYGCAMRLRALLYRAGLFSSGRLAKPVVSVGNLTVGGTGKTPAVAFIARFFLERGKRVAVLSRGYGGSAHGETHIVSDGNTIFMSAVEAGDEPYLLAATIPGLMVIIGPDRYRAGKFAEERLNPDIFILDDGFQHQGLHRDLDILLLDSEKPYGNGHLFPAGFLREPVSAAKRADLVIFTRCRVNLPDTATEKPHSRAFHHLTGLVIPGSLEVKTFGTLQDSRVMAFAGIADPGGFFDSLEKAGVSLITTLAFPDHSIYGEEEIAALTRLRDASRCASMLTTEKDAVKLTPWLEKLGTVYAVRLEMRFEDESLLRIKLEDLAKQAD